MLKICALKNLAFLLIFTLICVSCVRDSVEWTPPTESAVNTPESSGVVLRESWPPKASVTVSGKPHRKVEFRKRDGEECDCENCFGLCDVRVSGGVTFGFHDVVITVPVDTSIAYQDTSRVYFLNQKPISAESEFVIDEDINMDSSFFQGQVLLHALILKSGEYIYHNDTILFINGTAVDTSYGYVDILTIAN